jgi:hypothetical protein
MKRMGRFMRLLSLGCFVLAILACHQENDPENTIVEINTYERYLEDFNSGKLDSSAFIITQDGGSLYYRYYSGSTIVNNLEYDLYYYSLCKYDLSGKLAWEYTYGNKSECNDFNKVIQLADGSILCTASRYKPDLSNYVHALIKLNRNGEFLWEKTFEGLDIEQLGSVYQTSDEGFILVGITHTQGEFDWILIKTDGEGNLAWSRNFGEQSVNETPQCIIQTGDNGYLITVLADNSYDEAEQLNHLYKLDQSGHVLSCTDLPSGTQYVNDMIKARDDGYILAIPYIRSETDELSLCLFKISNSGEIMWTREHPLELHISLEVRIMALPDSGYFFMDRYLLLKFNDSGDLIG